MNTGSDQGRWEFDENGNVHYVPPAGTDTRDQRDFDGDPGQRDHARSKHDDGWHWLLIVLGFMFWWPVGLVLLFLQLGGKWPGNQKTGQEFRRATAAAKNAARQFRQGQKAQQGHKADTPPQGEPPESFWVQEEREKRMQKQQKKTAKKARRQESGERYGLGRIGLLRGIGGVMAGLFGFAFVMELIDDLTYFIGWDYLLSETLPVLALALAGVTLIGVAGSRKRRLTRFQKYLTMIGGRSTVSIHTLAEAMGVSEKKVEKDLEEMLERGFWDSGYVDAARKLLVLDGSLAEPAAPEPQPQPEQTAEDEATVTLRRIRHINDAIANPELSEKIDRIEELTAKIFKLLKERPEKSGELRSFMNYYLPQTLKILESYSKLEAQGIEGENITEAKGKIEGMMDKLVDGYETQLDKLFADDVLDISADLKVMESMLEKDGLTADSELRL